MSMDPETENFDRLRQLLLVLRHESPPPRYFNDFSGQVIARIRADAASARSESLGALLAQSTWAKRLWRMIEHRPAVSGILTAAVCGLLVVGVFASDNPKPSFIFSADGIAQTAAPQLGATEQNSVPDERDASGLLFASNSTNLSVQLRAGPSLFEDFNKLGVPQRVNGMPMGPK